MKILVIDDNDDVRNSLAEVLAIEHHEVMTAATGRQALDRLAREAPIDVIITDLMLPGLSGLALLDDLRQRPACPPIIVLTGMEDLPDVAPPVVAAFRKPVPPDDLLAALDGLRPVTERVVEEVLKRMEEDSPFPPLKK